MFGLNGTSDQVVYLVVVAIAISAITLKLTRAFRRKGEKPWPVFFVGLYNILLLILFLFGMMTDVDSEGFGFIPLLLLTLPWGGLAIWFLANHTGLAHHNFAGIGFDPTLLINFIIFNVLAGPANSGILYFLLKRRQRKVAEDEAWEQARRNR
jgi:hypothetical protein